MNNQRDNYEDLVLAREEVRNCDKGAIERYGIDGLVLMAGDLRALKKRTEGAPAGTASKMPGGTAETTFLELSAPVRPGCGECTLELENASGAKLRVHLKGFEAPDLAALGRSFWRVE